MRCDSGLARPEPGEEKGGRVPTIGGMRRAGPQMSRAAGGWSREFGAMLGACVRVLSFSVRGLCARARARVGRREESSWWVHCMRKVFRLMWL